MKIFKKFSLWMTLFAVLVVLYNITGNDDKNILLFITSPPNWITEFYRIRFPFLYYYLMNIIFWFLFGFVIDFGIAKLKKHNKNR